MPTVPLGRRQKHQDDALTGSVLLFQLVQLSVKPHNCRAQRGKSCEKWAKKWGESSRIG